MISNLVQAAKSSSWMPNAERLTTDATWRRCSCHCHCCRRAAGGEDCADNRWQCPVGMNQPGAEDSAGRRCEFDLAAMKSKTKKWFKFLVILDLFLSSRYWPHVSSLDNRNAMRRDVSKHVNIVAEITTCWIAAWGISDVRRQIEENIQKMREIKYYKNKN